MLVDVLHSRNSFMLSTSVRLSMNYALNTTERNGGKLEFEIFTYTNFKIAINGFAGTFARFDVSKVPAKPLMAILSLFQPIRTTMKLTPQKRSWYKMQKQ